MTDSVLDLFRLDGKVAIVTGASSGLGVAFAQALAEAGAVLVPVAANPIDAVGQAYQGGSFASADYTPAERRPAQHG